MQTFQEYLEYGEEGEHIVADYLMNSCDASVLPLYQFEDKKTAPYLIYKDSKYKLPDLTVWKESKIYFIEVKRKRQWVRFAGNTETGVDSYLYDNYVKIQDITGTQIYLWFVHEDEEPVGFFYISIDNFKKDMRYWDGKAKGKQVIKAMVFTDIKNLTKI